MNVVTDVLKLLAAIVALATALVGLNKAGVVDVPVINSVPAFNPSGEIDVPDDFQDFPGPSTRVEVPAVRGLPVADARARLEAEGFSVSEMTVPDPLCDHEQGIVDDSLPREGTEVFEGGHVTLYVCE